jgi:hypothetical protein
MSANETPIDKLFSLRNVKTTDGGMEGGAFSATILYRGAKLTTVYNDGNGGSNVYSIDVRKSAPFKELVEWFFTTRPQFLFSEYDGEFLLTDSGDAEGGIDIFIEKLQNDMIEEKWLRRHCRTKTLFRLHSTALKPVGATEFQLVAEPPKSEWLELSMDWATHNVRIRAGLQKKYGADLAEIANERFA